MTDVQVLGVFVRALVVAGEVMAPLVGLMLAVGLAVSIAQAATGLQDPTLTYVPRLAAAAAGILVFGGWMLGMLVHFSSGILSSLGTVSIR
jgi:flagellar biosynthetic protein FliQ